jgi:hypothetical protein
VVVEVVALRLPLAVTELMEAMEAFVVVVVGVVAAEKVLARVERVVQVETAVCASTRTKDLQ